MVLKNIELILSGAGQPLVSRKSLVSSREFFITELMKMNNLDRKLTNPLGDRLDRRARSAHKELVTSYSLLVTRTAFTMAEILLSLTIIGVVAAITLPSLTGNINERTWNTQRKALYARMSQAISLMPALNGYGTTDENAAETFITSGLSKVLKINNICDKDHIKDCGFPREYTNMTPTKITTQLTLYELSNHFSSVSLGAGSNYSAPNSNVAAFETANGETLLTFYNRVCRTDYLNEGSVSAYGNVNGAPEATMCLNFLYDLNGNKGPNTVGKDIGIITVFNATDSITVAPMPSSNVNANNNSQMDMRTAVQACKQQDTESRIPNIHELSAMLINKQIINLTENASFWSGTVFTSTATWGVNTSHGFRNTIGNGDARSYVRCVKRD